MLVTSPSAGQQRVEAKGLNVATDVDVAEPKPPSPSERSSEQAAAASAASARTRHESRDASQPANSSFPTGLVTS